MRNMESAGSGPIAGRALNVQAVQRALEEAGVEFGTTGALVCASRRIADRVSRIHPALPRPHAAAPEDLLAGPVHKRPFSL